MAHRPQIGGQVEMFDGSHRGTITEIEGEFSLLITWDDGETGHVHPNDVKHLTNTEENASFADTYHKNRAELGLP